MRRVGMIVLSVLASACNFAFDIQETVAIDEYAPCYPLPYDELRYRDFAYLFTWQAARDACTNNGLDLAVMDEGDSDELAMQQFGAPLPFWLGVSYGTTEWIAVDNCTPAFVPAPPASPQRGECLIQTSAGMLNHSCAQTYFNGNQINTLCETERPTPQCRRVAEQRVYMVTTPVGEVRNFGNAQRECQAIGMHVLEINSSKELDFVRANVALGIPKFWVAAQHTGSGFESPTTCPQIFKWQGGEPILANNVFCVTHEAAMQMSFCSDAAAVICEQNVIE